MRTCRAARDPHDRRVLRRRLVGAARRGRPTRRCASARDRRPRAICGSTRSSRRAAATGAEAIHPGYGFLSRERRRSPTRARTPGSPGSGRRPPPCAPWATRRGPRRWPRRAGCPSCPATTATTPADEALRAHAGEVGYPLLVKASAGGGGRGMRVVREPAELDEALDAARREAAASFGDDRLLLERYVARPRHVEVQILGDAHGDARPPRRARVQRPAPAPEADRGVAVARRDAARSGRRWARRRCGSRGRRATPTPGRWSSCSTRTGRSSSSRSTPGCRWSTR